MLSMTGAAPCTARRAASSGLQWLAPTKPMTLMPAATPAITPGTLSSTTTQRSHPGRRVEEQVGGGLAACDLDGAEDVRVKAVVEAHQRQGVLQPLGPAARGDACPANQRIEHRGDAGDGLQLALEQRPQPSAMAIGEICRERPVARLDVGHHPGPADA